MKKKIKNKDCFFYEKEQYGYMNNLYNFYYADYYVYPVKDFDSRRMYSEEEINKMIENKSIYILTPIY
jgi:hypothetical protein